MRWDYASSLLPSVLADMAMIVVETPMGIEWLILQTSVLNAKARIAGYMFDEWNERAIREQKRESRMTGGLLIGSVGDGGGDVVVQSTKKMTLPRVTSQVQRLWRMRPRCQRNQLDIRHVNCDETPCYNHGHNDSCKIESCM